MPTKITNEESNYRIKEEVDINNYKKYTPQKKVIFWWFDLGWKHMTFEEAETSIENDIRKNSRKKIKYTYY